MAERARALMNQIADAVVERLETIGDGDGWLTQPQTVKRFAGIADKERPRPALLVRVTGWGPNVPETNNRGDAAVELKILVLTRSAGNADEALQDAVADVLSETGGGDPTYGQLCHGGLFPDSYVAETDIADGGAGEGMAEVTLKGQALWSATAP